MIRTLSLFLLSCAFISSAFAAPSVKTPDGIRFEIQTASPGTSDSIKYISFDLILFNESDTKKINFDEGFNTNLTDEFGNHYRPLARPADHPETAAKPPSNFPSIYPGESYTKTFFFEAPVKKAARLRLEISGPMSSATEPLAIEFPVPISVAETGTPSAIDIVSPEDGAIVTAGEMFPLNVKVNANELPFKIIIVAFAKTLEDPKPLQNNTYNITAPTNTPKGPSSISIIGYWTDPKGKRQVLSNNVVIQVNPGPTPSL